MSLPVSAASSARWGMQMSLRRLDRAAETIALAGLDLEPVSPGERSPTPNGETAGNDVDLAGAMVDMLIAQRAFSANLRVLETATEMSKEIVNLGHRRGGA